MTSINREWIDKFLKIHLEGSPITIKIDEDEFFHPNQYIQYTIRFTFNALKNDNKWISANSFFTVTSEGLDEEDADQKFISFYGKVMDQYREFVGEKMGFMEYAKEIHKRLRECQAERTSKKTIKDGIRSSRHKRA